MYFNSVGILPEILTWMREGMFSLTTEVEEFRISWQAQKTCAFTPPLVMIL